MPTYAALLYYTEDYDWSSPELADRLLVARLDELRTAGSA